MMMNRSPSNTFDPVPVFSRELISITAPEMPITSPAIRTRSIFSCRKKKAITVISSGVQSISSAPCVE